MKLSDDLNYWRAERPDEWTMDDFVRKAVRVEAVNADLLSALHHVQDLAKAAIAKAESPPVERK